MSERTVAEWRLVLLQATWSYERMHGIGMGYAAEPLLADLESLDPRRLAEARVRASEPFNSHPTLAAVALGASVRAELDGVPGTQITRLKSALGGPLGSLGDQFFWAGVVPLVCGVALALAASGWVWSGIAVVIVGYNIARWATARWGLKLGLSNGMSVGAALGASWLPGAANAIGPWAAGAVGLALPIVFMWFVRGSGARLGIVVAAIAIGVAALSWRFQREVPPVRLALGLVALVLLARLGGA